jgi:dTDP-4-amino-4,6-dideoxygalactose transaminase
MAKNISIKNDLPLMTTEEGIVLFYPHVPLKAIEYVSEVLNSRWIGQGPMVDKFEKQFKNVFGINNECLAVGSGTDALHLAYLLADIKKDDEVLVPLFTCTATTIPLLYIGAKPIMVDVDINSLNICIADLKRKINKNTKAIVCVHYGGIPCEMDEIRDLANLYGIPVIEDAAHALGSKFNDEPIGNISDFTIFSFQAIKQLTTGDGGMLVIKNKKLIDKAKKLRWFGIHREDKQMGIWENDIVDIGYKYQMTDIAASIGLAGIEEYSITLNKRKTLFNRYLERLKNSQFKILHSNDSKYENSYWLCTIIVDDYKKLQVYLRDHKIESAQTHYRNDRYSIFNNTLKFPNMDFIDDKYLILPLHTKMSLNDVDYICDIILTYENQNNN